MKYFLALRILSYFSTKFIVNNCSFKPDCMLNHYLLRRRYRILFAAACIVIAFITFSFTEKGGSSDNSFPGFYEKGAQDETDTIPKRKSRKRSAMDRTNNTDSRTIDEQIEEALERVEDK